MASIESCLDDTKPRSRTLAFALPNELWLDILSGFTYYQLKKASRICKTMQAITMVSSCVPQTFRYALRPLFPPSRAVVGRV